MQAALAALPELDRVRASRDSRPSWPAAARSSPRYFAGEFRVALFELANDRRPAGSASRCAAPIWLSNGREWKYASDSSLVVFVTAPVIRTCRSSSRPEEQQARARVVGEVAALGAVVVACRRRTRASSDALQQHGARRRARRRRDAVASVIAFTSSSCDFSASSNHVVELADRIGIARRSRSSARLAYSRRRSASVVMVLAPSCL